MPWRPHEIALGLIVLALTAWLVYAVTRPTHGPDLEPVQHLPLTTAVSVPAQ